ncbi:M12 family metallo-peptidase [Polaribacter sp. HL-MS24]|uniref:M12 family metallo-peptidase n=1 Tax=Polaribacter sp. HL-MS24 TaxID=3077735 RepID=UPI002934490C|nr:M12 family metallo-peptidase [Polaribacter sp. HL-MS24]WOC39283.1 zinc-dependent metalloprotease family protein [Polaribacter sp. HL-MS24]
MKKLIILLCFLSVTLENYAQSRQQLPKLFQVADVPEATVFGTTQKMKGRFENPLYKEIRQIQFTDIATETKRALPANSGYFQFSIPSGKRTKMVRNVLVSPTKIETMPSGDYTYIADLMTGQNGKGTLILLKEKGKIFGSMTLNDRVFRIEHLESGKQILVELNQKILNSPHACGNREGGKISRTLSHSAKTVNQSCNSKIVRVLVLFTDEADNVSNPNQLAPTLINELTTALSKSKIYSSNLRFQLVGVERIGYTETGNPEIDLDNLVSNNDLNNRRQNARADLVVVLTDGDYFVTGGQILGIATLDEYSQPNVGHVAIVEADAGNVTFAHEVGHLMGCRHDNDSRINVPNLSNTAKGHNWYYRNWFLGRKRYQKSVVASGTTRGSRVLHFSNPSVKAHSKARDNTGTSSRNNFVQLKNAASVVGCYDDFDDMIVRINGPSIVEVGETITLNASVSNCSSRTYRWEVSHDGFSYSFLGTGSSVSYRVLPLDNNNSVTFRLTVTCSDGQVRTAFRSVYIENTDCGNQFKPCFPELRLVELAETDVNKQDSTELSFILYPNPVSEVAKLAFNQPIDDKITVEAYSMFAGKSHRLYQGRFNASNEILLNVSRLNQGLYQLFVTIDGKELDSKRMIIKR